MPFQKQALFLNDKNVVQRRFEHPRDQLVYHEDKVFYFPSVNIDG